MEESKQPTEADREKLKNHFWVSVIIESCKNTFHFEAVDNLINLWAQKYEDEELESQLRMKRTDKWNEIHNILN